MTAWTGIAITAAGVLCGKAGQLGMGLSPYGVMGQLAAAGLCAVSPAFVSLLLLKVSRLRRCSIAYPGWILIMYRSLEYP